MSSSTSTTPTTNGVVIFCHGSGDTGQGVESYVRAVAPQASLAALRDAGISFAYPTAQSRPYRLAGGFPASVWFDRYGGMEPTHPEDTASVESSATRLNELIDDLIARGIPAEKIALGGFSMGGGIALQTAARSSHKLGAVFALSSYLCDDSLVWAKLKQSTTGANNTSAILSAPVFIAHGGADDFVLTEWGENTANQLKSLGANVRPFVRVRAAGHEMTTEELEQLFEFLLAELTD